MHALIIEDESLIALAIEDALLTHGFDTVEIAPSPAAALEAVERHRPDLITSDVQLKPGCGIATVRTIRANDEIPVIFITGNLAEVSQKMPTYPALAKPFSEKQLLSLISDAMRPN